MRFQILQKCMFFFFCCIFDPRLPIHQFMYLFYSLLLSVPMAARPCCSLLQLSQGKMPTNTLMRDNSKFPIHLKSMFLDCGGKRVPGERSHSGAGRTCKLLPR